MTQPKRTASRLLSALLGLIMLLSLLPTVTLAAERVPEELKAIKVTSDRGDRAVPPSGGNADVQGDHR